MPPPPVVKPEPDAAAAGLGHARCRTAPAAPCVGVVRARLAAPASPGAGALARRAASPWIRHGQRHLRRSSPPGRTRLGPRSALRRRRAARDGRPSGHAAARGPGAPPRLIVITVAAAACAACDHRAGTEHQQRHQRRVQRRARQPPSAAARRLRASRSRRTSVTASMVDARPAWLADALPLPRQLRDDADLLDAAAFSRSITSIRSCSGHAAVAPQEHLLVGRGSPSPGASAPASTSTRTRLVAEMDHGVLAEGERHGDEQPLVGDLLRAARRPAG